jgi:opacity protein-like surface antigen
MKLSLLLLALLFSSISLAQPALEQGVINLNGTLSFSRQSSDDINDGNSVLSLNPQAGYFVINNLSAGLSLSYNNTRFLGRNFTTWSIGPSVRYYIGGNNIIPFASVGYSYFEEFNSLSSELLKGNSLTLGAGINYFLNQNVALETVVNYTFENTTLPASYDLYYYNNKISRQVMSIAVGVNYFLF